MFRLDGQTWVQTWESSIQNSRFPRALLGEAWILDQRFKIPKDSSWRILLPNLVWWLTIATHAWLQKFSCLDWWLKMSSHPWLQKVPSPPMQSNPDFRIFHFWIDEWRLKPLYSKPTQEKVYRLFRRVSTHIYIYICVYVSYIYIYHIIYTYIHIYIYLYHIDLYFIHIGIEWYNVTIVSIMYRFDQPLWFWEIVVFERWGVSLCSHVSRIFEPLVR